MLHSPFYSIPFQYYHTLHFTQKEKPRKFSGLDDTYFSSMIKTDGPLLRFARDGYEE